MLPRILALALFTTFPLLAQEPAQTGKVLEETWAIMNMGNAPVGYVHTRITEKGTGDARRITTAIETRMKINRLGSTISIEQDSLTIEKGDGSLVRVDSRMLMSNQEKKSQVFFEGDKVRLVTELMGRKRESQLSCPKGMVGPHRLQVLAVEHGFKPGTKWKAVTFVGELESASGVSNEVVGEEEVDLGDGQKRKLTKMIVVMEKVKVPGTAWVDETGLALKVVTLAGGINTTLLVSTKEKALAAVGAGKLSPDLFKKTVIVAQEFLPFARRTTAAVMHVKAKNAALKVSLPSARRQIVGEKDAKGVYTIHLSRVVPATGKTGVRPLKNIPKQLKQSLASNTMIQSDEAEILAIAKKAVGGEKDAWRAAQTLEKWVSMNLTNKGYGVGFASALEVCRDRAGDCSEHAVLLAALCRASGIPARVSMGVVYVGGIWAGHAWNEVWIEGEWYALDATIGLGSVDALHLTMASMTMRDGDAGSELASLITVLGNLDVRVQTLEYSGETIQVSGKVTVEGDRYLNRLWGFSCQAPEGFKHQPEKPRARIGYHLLEIEGKNSAGRNCEIDLDVFGVQPGLNHDVLVKKLGRGAKETKAIEVDGRKGRLFDSTRGSGRRKLIAVIDAKDAVYVFALDRVAGEEDVKMFTAFLGQVDFDLAR